MIRAAAGIFRQAACSSGDDGRNLHRLTFPGQLSGNDGRNLHRWAFGEAERCQGGSFVKIE